MRTEKISLNSGWKFHYGEEEEAFYKGFDDSSWESVTIPHDWSVSFPFSKEHSSGTGYLPGKIGWYRKSFTAPKGRVNLVFDGVYKHAKVWVNSYYLGTHAYGYTPFSYDITDLLSKETENVISVRVEHNDLADSRWFTGSGIYRDVYLIASPDVHLAKDGISFVTDASKDYKAFVHCTYEIENHRDEDVEVAVASSLVSDDTSNDLLLNGTVIPAHGVGKILVSGIVNHPTLWCLENPFLYTLVTKFFVNGEENEELPIPVGIRTFSFDAKEGFFLNERPVKLKGVCVHHDGGALGAAMTKEVWRRRLLTLKECGCNAIRMSHNPHMPALYDLCDELGFLVMDEAFDEWENAKNKWWQGHNVYPPRHQGYYEDFPEWHETDLRAMVRRDRNHPSVILYSIGNEIDYPNDPYCHPSFAEMTGNNDKNKPAAERMYDPNKPNMERLVVIAKELAAIVKDEEETALVTMALAYPELSVQLGVGEYLDVLGYNYKEHLYAKTHEAFPNKPLLGSENGHSYMNWMAVRDNKDIAGQFLWTGIDYFGETIGWPVHGSFAGLLTTAGFPKTEFYQTKSYWDSNPTPYLATVKKPDQETWLRYVPVWDYEAGETILVKCFAPYDENATVAFYKEDTCIGEVSFDKQEGAYIIETTYEACTLCAKYKLNGNVIKEVSLSKDSKLEDVSLKLFEEDSTIGYIYQVEVTLEDENHKRLLQSDSDLEVSVSGAGELVCIDNGDLTCTVDCKAPVKPTYMGKSVIYVRRISKGDITVSVSVKNICKELVIHG